MDPATPPGARPPTLAEIAVSAGVSKSLVSIALRGDGGVKTETRRRIIEVAEALGYPSNALARRLVKPGPRIIGALVTDLTNPFHTEVVAGIESLAERHSCSVMIANGRQDRDWMATQLQTFLTLDVDGIVVVSTWVEPDALSAAAARAPIVVVGSSAGELTGIDTVESDDEHGTGQAVDHLVAMGHSRIAFVTESNRASSTRRYAGYRQAMRRMYGEDLAQSVSIDELERDRGLLASLVRERRATGMIAANDMTAIRLAGLAEDLGIRMPQELSIVGYDNTLLARTFRPRLSSVDQPRHDMGERAVQMVLERLSGRDFDCHEILKPRLVTRESTWMPPDVPAPRTP